jgi:hypothetical protein
MSAPPAYVEVEDIDLGWTEPAEPFLGMTVDVGKDDGIVIAHGYYSEDYTPTIFSVMMFMEAPRESLDGSGATRNYLLAFLQGGKLSMVRYYANIIEAAEAYADEYGMDI